MADLLGNRLLPESLASKRRDLRNRLNEIRQPLRDFRTNMVPGPNVVEMTESQFMGLRNKVTERDSAMNTIARRRSGNNSERKTQEPNNTGNTMMNSPSSTTNSETSNKNKAENKSAELV